MTALSTIRELSCPLSAYLARSDSTLRLVVSVHRENFSSAHLFEGKTLLCAKLRLSHFIFVYLPVVKIVSP